MKRIQQYAAKKIVATSMCLFLLLLFYLVPTHEEIITTKENIKEKESVVYLLDNDNYVSKVITYFDSKNIKEEIKHKIDVLINGSENASFISLIPKGTKLNSVNIEKDSVYLDFSKEILNVDTHLEEEMIESIVFTITEINGINKIYLSVENRIFDYLPNSKKIINYPLTREYGINKDFDIISFHNINKTTVFFEKKEGNNKYLVPITKISNNKEDKIKIIIKELKSSVNAQDNLISNLDNKIKLIDYELKEDKLYLVFNEYMYENNNINSIEKLLSSSIYENYKVNEIIYLNKEKEVMFKSSK